MSLQTIKTSTASEALPYIARCLLEDGDEVGSRNGRVKEFLNTQIVLTDPQRREVLTVNRGANVFAQIAETMWVLRGRNDIEWLSAYLPRAKDFSDDGKTWRGGYGPRIRQWSDDPWNKSDGLGDRLDQLAHVVDLLQKDPLSRRAVIAIYDPVIDTEPGKDIPCNDFIQFQSRLGALHMTVTVRSNDLMWGWSGINAFEWSTLQEIVAHLLGVTVGTLTFNIGSLHLYERHWQKASTLHSERHDDLTITPFQLPDDLDRTLESVDILVDRWFQWESSCREGRATPELLDDLLEEPLFRSWAAAIAYYWQREDHWLETFKGTALAVAVARTPASLLPKPSEPPQTSRGAGVGVGATPALRDRTRAFYEFVAGLHATKHASYGDSWKKRGEKMSILANMARKVDRMGIGDEYDSSADTLIDFLVYALKYECWLDGVDDGPDNVDRRLSDCLMEHEYFDTVDEALDIAIADVQSMFNHYCDHVDVYTVEGKRDLVHEMAMRVAPYARDVWHNEQQNANPPCRFCGGLKSNHVPGGSRYYCEKNNGFQAEGEDEYRGADAD